MTNVRAVTDPKLHLEALKIRLSNWLMEKKMSIIFKETYFHT